MQKVKEGTTAPIFDVLGLGTARTPENITEKNQTPIEVRFAALELFFEEVGERFEN